MQCNIIQCIDALREFMTILQIIILAGVLAYIFINLNQLKGKKNEFEIGNSILSRDINRLQEEINQLDNKIRELRKKVHVEHICTMLFSFELADIFFKKKIITRTQFDELIKRWHITEEEYIDGSYNLSKKIDINGEKNDTIMFKSTR